MLCRLLLLFHREGELRKAKPPPGGYFMSFVKQAETPASA
jgi:hypothetical protein